MANNNNNGNMFDIYGMQQMADMIKDAFQQNYTLAQNDFAKDAFKQVIQLVKNPNELTKKDIELVFSKYLTPLLKGTYGGGNDFTNFMNVFKTTVMEMQRKENMTAVLLSNLLSGGVSLGYKTSESAVQNGEGNKPFKIDTPKDTLTAKTLEKIFGSSKLVTGVNAIQQAVFDFFNWNKGTHKKRVREFIDDLMDGLSKSKFVGGAITDLVRLATFFAANWLKQFGPIGKALAVGLVALGPIIGTKIADILVKSLVSTIGNVFKAGLLGLGTLLKSAFLSLIGKGGLVSASIAGRAGASAVTGISSGSLALGSFLAAGAVGMLAADSFKKEGAREKTAGGILALGSAGFGVAGAASLLAPLLPVLAPVAPIAIAVAAIATGIGLVVKFFPQIMDFFKKIGEWLGIIAKKDEDGNEKGVPEGSRSKTIGEKLTGHFTTRDYGKLKVNQDGSVANLDKLSQSEAATQLESLRSYDKQSFDNVYELAEDGIAHMASFQNDIKMKDSDRGGKEAAVLYRGATSDLLELRKSLIAAGMSEERANLLMYTSGMSSKDSKHKKGGWNSHSNNSGFATDMAGIGWTLEESKFAYPILIEALAKKGFTAKAEDNTGFTTIEKMKNNNLHLDIKPNKDVISEGGLVNLRHNDEAKKIQSDYVVATEKSIKIKEEELKKLKEEAVSEDSEGGKDKTEKEQKAIELKEAELNKYKQYKKVVKDATPDQLFTGNEMLSSVLKDSLILQQYQSRQQ